MTIAGSGRLSLIHGNALAIPLADQSVHLIVTSPPYFALRAYADGGETYDGQLGSEATPHHFLAALWAVFDECWRVLRDDGSCWVNLGDKFSSGSSSEPYGASPSSTLKHDGRKNPQPFTQYAKAVQAGRTVTRKATGGLRPKSRMLLPHRFALGMIDPEYRAFEEHRAGLTPTAAAPQWICRMDAVWAKKNHLPESATDRVQSAHEYWLHFTKSERYFASMDEIRESIAQDDQRSVTLDGQPDGGNTSSANSLGRIPGSVWTADEEAGTEWIGKFGICPRCGELKVAGNGSADDPRPDTEGSGSTGATTSLTRGTGTAGCGRRRWASTGPRSSSTGRCRCWTVWRDRRRRFGG